MNKTEFGIFTGDQLFECGTKEVPLIELVLNEGDRMCISAKPKVGKTVLIQQLMHNLTMGTPFLETYTTYKKCNVLYIQAEGTRRNMASRFRNMERAIPFDCTRIFHINKRGLGLQEKSSIDKLKELARTYDVNYDVIVFDPLYKLMHGGSLNAEQDVIKWTGNVDEFIGEYGATGIVIHHDTEKVARDKKGNIIETPQSTLFGSTFWSGFFTHTYKLSKHKDLHYLKEGVQRDGGMIEHVTMKMITPQKDPLGRLYYTANDKDVSVNEFKLTEFLKRERRYMYPDIYTDACISRSSFHNIINRMKANKSVGVEHDEHGKTWYVWLLD